MKKYLYRKKLFLYLFLFSLLLLGCSKANTLMRILGTWTVVNVSDMNSPVIEQWVFDIDDTLRIDHYLVSKPDSLFNRNKGNYGVKIKTIKRFIDVSGFQGGYDFLNSSWEIVKSDGKVLTIVKDADQAVIIKEFVKK